MTVYVRKFPCAVCGENVYWDSETQLLSCGCGKFHANSVDLEQFIAMPKYAKHYWKREFEIDSISFFDGEYMQISDQRNKENPRMVVSFIFYPKENRVQVRLAFKGKFHKEKPSYYVKDPKKWKENVWITIPIGKVKELREFLKRDPILLASWM